MEHHQTNMLQGSCVGFVSANLSSVHQDEFSHKHCIVKTVQESI